MAQPLICDVCGQEEAYQMITNLQSGEVLALGPACIPMFYGQAALASIGAGDHAGPAGKCQACRRFHEAQTTPVAPLAVPADDQNDHTDEPADDTAAADAP